MLFAESFICFIVNSQQPLKSQIWFFNRDTIFSAVTDVVSFAVTCWILFLIWTPHSVPCSKRHINAGTTTRATDDEKVQQTILDL